MDKLVALLLAAGEGKRMKSKKPKVLHKIMGKALLEWVCESVLEAGIRDCVGVVGHKSEEVEKYMGNRLKYFYQKEQLGTGHAVMQTIDYIKDNSDYVLILCGDTPLIKSDTLNKAIDKVKNKDFGALIITTTVNNPKGYGRIIRDNNQNVLKIVEEKDANENEKSINEINSGMYCFKTDYLIEVLRNLDNNNSQSEYYLTDTIEMLLKKDIKVGALKINESNEIMGINDRKQLSIATQIIKEDILSHHMENGVTIIDPKTTFIDKDVKIGIDTTIMPGSIIQGNTIIGEDSIIGPNANITSTEIGDFTKINNSTIVESKIGNFSNVGPYAYIRPKSVVGNNVKIGDFVEIKATVIGDKTKISHLTYVGDAQIGKNVNIGCGVVVVNYDGKKKNKTIVGDNAFIGCNTNLVSPVEVKSNSYIAAGSTITKEVPENSLAIARSKQTIIDGWVKRKGMSRGID
ncbi:MAG: bifunctional UDP-N-acetylglucosamine diphosphorylase/glucosamine-1-phosphate N-acetyltransferase GlmU [Clostridiales bacterium]